MSNPNAYVKCAIWTTSGATFMATVSGTDLGYLRQAIREGWAFVDVMRVEFEGDVSFDVGPLVLRPEFINAIVADEI